MANAVVIRFPIERIRRAARKNGERIFAPLHDEARLETDQNRFNWACTIVTAMVGVILQISIG